MNQVILGMPHLNYNGIDYVWLSKELGNNHWSSLGSMPIFTESKERLYASFFCIELDFLKGQSAFKENAELVIDTELFRLNNQVYRSHHELYIDNKLAGEAKLDSLFVKKTANNKLIKDDPHATIVNVRDIEDLPSIHEHKRLKRQFAFNSADAIQLPFSPELYFNNVQILYFANYINLVGLSEYLTTNQMLGPIRNIKIYFFKNISVTDQVYGSTKIQNSTSTTTLFSNGQAIAHAIITR